MTLHLVLADRALDVWRSAPSLAPFPIDDPTALNAFHQGAFGPDLGYFPGGHRFLSDLAHCVRSADLARTLLHSARSPRERAFAWGWVTHVLGDQAIHPWIGRGVGELKTGRRNVFISGDGDPSAHVRVETGVDAWYAARNPRYRSCRPSPVFDGETIRFLARAYHHTYALRFDPALLLSSHLAVTRMSVQALRTVGVLGSALEWEAGDVTAVRWAREGMDRVRDTVRAALGRDSLLMALLTPVAPSSWLMEAVEQVVDGFGSCFRDHWEAGGDLLENRNLDTGDRDGEGMHRGTRATLRVLRSRGGTGLQRPAGAALTA